MSSLSAPAPPPRVADAANAPAPPLRNANAAAAATPRAAQPAAARAAVAAPTPRAVNPGAGGVVLDVADVSGTVRILRLSRPPGFSFRAGQAIKLGLPSVPVRRTYSIASAPHEAHLELCVERVPGGVFSSQLFDLAPGARLELSAKAKGSLSLQSDKRLHLLVATVTGIAPLRSLLRDALAAPGGAGDYWVLHGASYADELPYADELTELSRQNPHVRYLPTVSRPESPRNQGWGGRSGRVEAHLLELARSIGPMAAVGVYACGHPEMVRNVQSTLGGLGYAVSGEDFG